MFLHFCFPQDNVVCDPSFSFLISSIVLYSECQSPGYSEMYNLDLRVQDLWISDFISPTLF